MNETATNSEYSVGQKMILVRDRHDPIVVNIDRLTKTQILVRNPEHLDDPKQVLRFKKSGSNSGTATPSKKHYTAGGSTTWQYSKMKLYDHSVEVMTELKRLRNGEIRRREEEIQATQKRHQEIADRKAQELAEVKEVCHDGQLALSTKLSMTQSDGTRIYILDWPVKASYFERKKGWETVMVVCKDVEEIDREKWTKWRKVHRDEHSIDVIAGRQACMIRQVEFYYTWINGGSCSFASHSVDRATNDEEALWETIRSVYTSW